MLRVVGDLFVIVPAYRLQYLDPTADIWYTLSSEERTGPGADRCRHPGPHPHHHDRNPGMEATLATTSGNDRAGATTRTLAVRPEPAPVHDSKSVRVPVPPPHVRLRRSLRDRDESDPDRCAVELVQRGRIILDVSAADLEAAESTFGPFHPTTWHFRNSLNEAQRSWDRLAPRSGDAAVETALREPPITVARSGRESQTRCRRSC